MDTGRSTRRYISLSQGGPTDYGSHLQVPVAMSSGEAEYISTAVACMRASRLRILITDMRFIGSENYNQDFINLEPARIIIDNEAAICIAKCDEDIASNRHVAGRYHYVQQGTALQEHKFEWIGTKYQLADLLPKPGSEKSFFESWKHIVYN